MELVYTQQARVSGIILLMEVARFDGKIRLCTVLSVFLDCLFKFGHVALTVT